VPLGLWFTYAILGLIGTNEVAVLSFLSKPWNALLMAAFSTTLLYHMALGLQDIVDDYVHRPGVKIFTLLLIRFVWIATTVTCIFALIRVAAST
jgi:succinate dehydrogenase / fumarate reductase membrane anchor subunit